MKKVVLKAVVFPLITLLSMTLIGNYTSAADTPQRGGTLKVIAIRATKALGAPWEVDNWFNIYGHFVMESLVHLDKNGNAIPHLATAFKVAPDGKSITFTIRKGVKFHDGTDLNAEAVKYSLDRVDAGTIARNRESVEVIDPYTVKLNLKLYDASIWGDLAVRHGMIASPTAAAKKTTSENQARDHMVGTGPYKFVNWSRDQYIKYERFDGYWQKGKPYPDAVEINFIVNPVTSVMAFKSGAGQLIMTVSAKDSKEMKAQGYEIVSVPYGVKTLTSDGANPDSPWANKKVREALDHAIDREAVAEAIGLGTWKPVYQACPFENSIGYVKDVEPREYDPAKAKKLLAEAGYPNGFETKILSKAEENQDLLVAIQTYLAEIGIKAKIELLDRGRYVAMHKDGWNNGIMYGTIGPRPYTIANNLGILTSKMPYNKPVYLPAGFEETLDKALATWDPDVERELTQKLYRMAYDNAMITPLWVEMQLGAHTKQIHNSGWCEVISTVWYPENAWLSK
ncbi:MAG: ABC transporter substrate-binding protein [Deltaproteobacteria bacterium]|nr:ABC transporter substrate-binding protein [Deltaproteobacteria bacterium]